MTALTIWNALHAQQSEKFLERKAFVQALPEALNTGERLQAPLQLQTEKQQHKDSQDKGADR
jgi:hypothetical protein